ncbi:zinc finger FYVE domain-containing 9 [Pelobates cultripes]|uniref:Zinc finger FYVE domain-containing protein n=1 Tax=Pelobates cultripes TaxID=61616 RepID=A0AAD1SX70_PELCU|nr:zinc finger FYVE domain-containing 9 [Pelobates cultripes]
MKSCGFRNTSPSRAALIRDDFITLSALYMLFGHGSESGSGGTRAAPHSHSGAGGTQHGAAPHSHTGLRLPVCSLPLEYPTGPRALLLARHEEPTGECPLREGPERSLTGSCQMENYFEEESCNLDKVLDEFEKNEDETVSPRLLEAKWNQILNPPSHRLADNPVLDSVSKSIIAIEAQLKDRSTNLSSPPKSLCENGEIICVAQYMPTMVTGDSSMEERKLIDQSGQPEIVSGTPAVHNSVESDFADVTQNMDSNKNVLLGDGLSPCNSPTNQSLMDTLCFSLDNEKPTHNQLVGKNNNQQPKDSDTHYTAYINATANSETSTCSTAQTQNSVSTSTKVALSIAHSIKELKITQEPEVGSSMSSTQDFSSSSINILCSENNTKESYFQLENPNLMIKGTVDEVSIKQQEKLSLTLHEAKQSNSKLEREPFSADIEPVSAEEVVQNNLICERKHFTEPCEINGSYHKTNNIETEEKNHSCPIRGQHKEIVNANVFLEDPCIDESEVTLVSEAVGADVLMSLNNGCDSYGMQNPSVARNPKSLPSKEDSVTEEKEIEECKSEYYSSVYEPQRDEEVMEAGVLVLNANGDQMKNHLHSLCGQGQLVHGQTSPKKTNSMQPVSIPFGGARPKQPTHLKLQIPKPLSEMLQSDLVPPNAGCSSKNKNDMLNKSNQGDNLASEAFREEAALRSPVTDSNGELGDYRGPCSPCLAVSADSPDNDLLAGQFGNPVCKPFSTLGEVAPVWVPDSQAPNCMKCESRFTFTKRRHHCRACGKVFCAACCSLKCKLLYMDKKEARVCVTCHSVLINAQAWENMLSASIQNPNPNNPSEYCSTIPPMQQAQASGALSSPPPTVMVPVGVLKHPGAEVSQSREQRRVWFADGILPNGEAADAEKATGSPAVGTLTVAHDANKSTPSNSPPSEGESTSGFCGSITQVGSAMNLIPEDGLPPILISTGVKGDYAVEEHPSQMSVMQQLEDGGPDPLVFVLNANLLAMVKIVNYVNRKCWCFTTKGMHAVGQAEIVILLQCLPDEKCMPRDLFCHFVELYREGLAGNVVGNLGHSFLSQNFLGSKEHGGFLYVTPTYQSLQDLVLPAQPYLFGILIQKWETPWAKVFPIRLMLRLGAEYRLYPCPLFSVRFRKPLFGETGHTIINVLADFRNYQYTLPVVQGLVVDMEVRKTSIKIPSNRYNEMMKAMNKSNEHVLAGGACFNQKADSHLVCVQNDDGNYQTQAISIHKQPRKVTGASFFVFSGALKTSSGFLAKSSIVEDGVMVQITAESMDALRQALREMKDFDIICGKADAEETQEHVYVQWVEDDKNFNKGVSSPIDGKTLESVTSVKIFHGSEYKANGKIIRWTEVFYLDNEEQQSGLSDPADHSRLTENVAKAFCLALCPHLKLLKEDGMTRLGLRVTLDADQVGYQAGSNGQPLPARYTNDLDSALVPVIHGDTCQLSEGPVTMELIFYLLENIS